MASSQFSPLHLPGPQHVSTIPQLRSSPLPIPVQHGQQNHPYGYVQQQQGGTFIPGVFDGLMTQPSAQMGYQVGKTAVMAGQEYMEQNLIRYVNISVLKHYFDVTNSYVVNKLCVVLFPWRQRLWSRQQQGVTADGQGLLFLPPREDINSPDMYIPLMASVTYVLLSTLLAGIRGTFRPELFGVTASNASAVVAVELLLLKLGTYFLDVSNESRLLDLVAYSGYKFVGVILTIAVSNFTLGGHVTRRWVGWPIFVYTYMANAFFLLRSLKYVLVPTTRQATSNLQRTRRLFLFFHSYGVQLILMWWLTSLS